MKIPIIHIILCGALFGSAHAETKSLVEQSEALASRFTIEDEVFKSPYIDVDEWRNEPIHHRYVHGGFNNTGTRFSFYFPEKEQYQGHFFQHVTPFPISENLAQKIPDGPYNKIGFSMDSGAYFVETNGGADMDLSHAGAPGQDQSITAYRANAAAAQFSRVVAQAIYDCERPYGYYYGGSGGAYRTIGGMENTRGVWDGAVPYVMGSPMAIPNVFSVRMHAMRILWDKFPQILDAIEPGGSGDPYAGLTEEEASAFKEVTQMGFPPKSWFPYKTMGVHGFSALYQGVLMADPTYFTDFWTKPGYYGYDHPESFKEDRLQFETKVESLISLKEAYEQRINLDASKGETGGGVDTAFKVPAGENPNRIVALKLERTPPECNFMGGDIFFNSGAIEGTRLNVARIVDDVIVFGIADKATVEKIKKGDAVKVDNSNFLAAQTYHRHQVPDLSYKVWDQFRDEEGKPIYPQRPMLLGPLFLMGAAGSVQNGIFEGKMIVVESLWDSEAFPWQADWYRSLAKKNLGDKIDDNFRLYYTDHALHGDEPGVEHTLRVVSYEGALQHALRDLSDWVEKGITPPESTSYTINNGQVIVPCKASERKGIQPTAKLTANGGELAIVKVGESVKFTAKLATPPSTGCIVNVEFDVEGTGDFPIDADLPAGKSNLKEISIDISHTFTNPGTYFPVVRVTSQRECNPDSHYTRIFNLSRVRVVVE